MFARLMGGALVLVGVLIVLTTLLFVLFPSPPTDLVEARNHTRCVAVTGASGYLAGHVIQNLLDRGYTVRGSVRSLRDEQKIIHLKQAFHGLELYEADLLRNGSFDAMFRGCRYVIHTASPFKPQVPDPQRDLIDPALKGTLNVLHSAFHAGIKRVVLTSSTAAIIPETPPNDPRRVFTDQDWNLESTLQRNPYRLSKRLAEEAAWKFVHEQPAKRGETENEPMELVVMNPSFMLGPPISNRTDATSIATVKSFLEGKFWANGTLPVCFPAVDVRDVARAHVLGLEVHAAIDKRFILASRTSYTHLQLAEMLTSDFEDWPLPTKQNGAPTFCPIVDPSPASRVLGLRFTTVSKAINDMAKAMVKMKMATRPPWHRLGAGRRIASALRRGAHKALGGGLAGAMAMVLQVLSLMWLRTTMNYQYRHGHSMGEALRLLYADGGIPRFYQGLLPALIQGPLSRFCDTAANVGMLAVLDSLPWTAELPIMFKTIAASCAAAGCRVLLMPVDTVKTVMQVEGRKGLGLLVHKVAEFGPLVLFDGALASLAATFMGHYPWFVTFNTLNQILPVATSFYSKVVRNGCMGCTATIVSDTFANSMRVIKTTKQTSSVAVTYTEVVAQIMAQDGLQGFFFRGLKTRLIANVLQGTLFSILWRIFMELFANV